MNQRIAWIWLCLLGLGAGSLSVRAQPSTKQAAWTVVDQKRIHGYVWIVRHRAMPNVMERTESGELWDARGRLVLKVAGRGVSRDWIGDLTGEGIPDLVFHTYEGGNHISDTFYVISLGRRPRCLLAYDHGIDHENDGIGGGGRFDDFTLRDLDGDGRKEILTSFDGYYGWESSFGSSAFIPLVLGYRNGHFVDVTSHYKRRLRSERSKALALMQDRIQQEFSHDHFQRVVQWYGIDLLLEGSKQAQKRLLPLLPEQYKQEFLARRKEIEAILARRFDRYFYPSLYSNRSTVRPIKPHHRR